jgi:branched-subunit amino acid ABC-type transport system permease component
MDFFLQNIVNALQWGSFYALIALGYSMVYSIMMLFNFAHGDIFMTGPISASASPRCCWPWLLPWEWPCPAG